jgi:hypothetical protein
MFAMLPYLTFFFQNDLGYSPLQGGLRLLPATLLTFVVPLATRTLTENLPPGPTLAVGLAICGLGLFEIRGLTPSSTWIAALPGIILIGFGIGIGNPGIARIALGVVPPARAGMASGISNTFRIGGLSIGVAALGAIFQSGISSALAGAPSSLAAGLAAEGPAHLFPHGTHSPLARTGYLAFLHGLNGILLVGAIVVGVGALAALVVRGRDFHQHDAPASEEAPVEAAGIA